MAHLRWKIEADPSRPEYLFDRAGHRLSAGGRV